jgi:branched-chain amino acid transport system ATP-binding protein
MTLEGDAIGATGEPMLAVAGLRAGYGRIQVLHGIDLEARAGELVALIGANGAGKTTLLRAISGLLRPSAGRVTIGGEDTVQPDPAARQAGRRRVRSWPAERLAAHGVAHVPENRLVFPGLSVADNLRLGAWTRRRRGLARGTGAETERVLQLFPRLAGRLGQAAGTLSGGEQQMLAIGRGLMAAPRLLLLDEPSLGLAPRLVTEIFAALGRLRDDGGLAIVLVEQNARAALQVADRALVMDRGVVALAGTPSALLADERVHAAYLGRGYAEVTE